MATAHDPAHVASPLDIAQNAAVIGGVSAIPGTAIGAFYGTLRTQTPALFAIASGAQCFAIGATFWGTRAAILNRTGLLNWWNITRGAPLLPRHDLDPSLADKVRASTVSGAFTGLSLGLLFRGPRNAVPGTFMFALFGWAGQHGYNYLDQRNSQELRQHAQLKEQGEDRPKETLMHKIAKSKWSPMSVLSDEEYIKMMEEKVLKVDAEIAMIDDRIESFRKKAREMEVQRLVQEQQKPAQEKK